MGLIIRYVDTTADLNEHLFIHFSLSSSSLYVSLLLTLPCESRLNKETCAVCMLRLGESCDWQRLLILDEEGQRKKGMPGKGKKGGEGEGRTDTFLCPCKHLPLSCQSVWIRGVWIRCPRESPNCFSRGPNRTTAQRADIRDCKH